jgi:para-nitrobenzyl esterase
MLATLRDAIYGWTSERLARSQTAAGAPAWLYVFDHCDAAARGRNLCAFHASELPYLFGLERTPPNWPRAAGAADRALSAAMLDYWVSFATTGVPRSRSGPAWPAYGGSESYMHFAEGPVARRDLLPGMFELQEELVSRRRRAGQPWFVNVGIAATPVPER